MVTPPRFPPEGEMTMIPPSDVPHLYKPHASRTIRYRYSFGAGAFSSSWLGEEERCAFGLVAAEASSADHEVDAVERRVVADREVERVRALFVPRRPQV